MIAHYSDVGRAGSDAFYVTRFILAFLSTLADPTQTQSYWLSAKPDLRADGRAQHPAHSH